MNTTQLCVKRLVVRRNVLLHSLWLFLLPLLFLPNFGLDLTTPYGTFEPSDLVLLPYLLFLVPASKLRRRLAIDTIVPLGSIFLCWALASTLLINVKYGYTDSFYVIFSLLKLGKFVLYTTAGILTVKALGNNSINRYMLSLIAASITTGVALAMVGSKSDIVSRAANLGYKTSNAMSVTAAILISFLAGIWPLRNQCTAAVRRMIPLALVTLVVGAAFSEGRGGWVAGICGIAYACCRGKRTSRSVVLFAGAAIAMLCLYTYSTTFQRRVDITFHPEIIGREKTAILFDEDGRIENARDSLGQFNSPVFGTGFFHRGGQSGLYATGSHNFYLQMFLETGIAGGFLILAIICQLWTMASSSRARRTGLDVPTKAALIAAAVGGMSGEYYYGGIGLLTLFFVLAACGSLPRIKSKSEGMLYQRRASEMPSTRNATPNFSIDTHI